MKDMKTKIIKFSLALLFTFGSFVLLAQGPPPPPGDPHGGNNDIPGGGAPVGSGLAIILTLGAAYGVRKVYLHFKEEKSTLEE